MKATAYLRVSTDAQDYQSQRNQIEAWNAVHGPMPLEWVSDAVSGSVPWQRRQLAAIIDAAAPGDIILVSEVSRLARSIVGVLTCIEAALAKDVTVIAARNDMRFGANIQSKVTLTIFGLAAEIERDLIRDRTRAALAAKRLRGEPLGRKVGQVVASKLDSRREEVVKCLQAKISKRGIARMLGVSPGTLYAWLKTNFAANGDTVTRDIFEDQQS